MEREYSNYCQVAFFLSRFLKRNLLVFTVSNDLISKSVYFEVG